MKPNQTTPQRRTGGLLAFGAGMLLILAATAPARAIPDLSVVGGSGVAGSTVAATIALSDDVGNMAASADVDLVFPPAQLMFFPPVVDNCTIDPRIAETHEIGGRLDGTNTVILSIFVRGTPPVIPHLGNGPLASCDFFIKAGVPVGTAALTIENPGLFDADGNPLDVNTTNGSIRIITQGPATPTSTPSRVVTPTATNTLPTVLSTPTHTNTVGTPGATSTPTNTGGTPGATSTPTNTGGTPAGTSTPTRTGGTPAGTSTPTRTGGTPAGTSTPTRTGGTPGATSTRTGGGGRPSFADSDSCNIVAAERSGSGGALALLLAPALILWARRRRF